jgi:rare lipoprotein A
LNKILLSLAFLLSFSVATQAGTECGVASWYGGSDGLHGKRTASGEIFNTHEFTSAHKALPFGTIVKVTNQKNSKIVVVRINDRGPFTKGRIIDLSQAAAKEIGLFNTGVGPVCIEW